MGSNSYGVAGVFKETASGASASRAARNQILDLAQARHIDAILVSELSRWGRPTQDLLDTPYGRMMATMLAGIAQFERDILSERVKSGLAAARARGKNLAGSKDNDPSLTSLPRRFSRPSKMDGHTDASPAIAAFRKTPSPISSDGTAKMPRDTILRPTEIYPIRSSRLCNRLRLSNRVRR